ncbi:GNAT family N-acetyltransferase [Agarilytica rhodophyticola]|uniref:GNAT family N-acetyltransferase n=1 Tax=Agarilytica rhodophyticola TaxID=1737490 RepID=UPI000B3455C7|nr:GNAT family N-acetyltransferase [Agarilytica rhodophyticola]
MKIILDDLSDGKVAQLLNEHLQNMQEYSPAESIHALDQEKLKDSAITFWSARINGELAGCGALKEISPTAGELKSMKTNDAFLRKGAASKILQAILQEAKERGYKTLSLETGSDQFFGPAINLYKKYGFVECGPFGDYKLDPYSKFYSVCLENSKTLD